MKLTKEDPPPGNGVKVYPNPVTNYVSVELFGTVSRSFKIDIVNISGIVVHSESMEFSGMYWNTKQIPVDNLSRGLYLVRIVSDDGIINRIIKIEKM